MTAARHPLGLETRDAGRRWAGRGRPEKNTGRVPQGIPNTKATYPHEGRPLIRSRLPALSSGRRVAPPVTLYGFLTSECLRHQQHDRRRGSELYKARGHVSPGRPLPATTASSTREPTSGTAPSAFPSRRSDLLQPQLHPPDQRRELGDGVL